MQDEIPVSPEAQRPDNESGDPEVPLIPHSAETSHNTHKPDAQAHHSAYRIYKAFYAVWMRIVWIGRHLRKANVWIALATVIMAGATGYLAIYARRQWKFIGDQLYEIGENGKDESRAQWAHIDIPQQLQIRTMVENGKVTSWVPEITMVNNGNTGTYNTVEVVSVSASQTEMPEACNLPDNGIPQHSDIGPHEAELFDAQPIPIAAIQSIQIGGHIYIYGGAVYRDVFQFYGAIKHGATWHLREFRYELRLDSAMGDVTSPSYVPPKSLVLYGPHNCTDGDCLDYREKTEMTGPPTDLRAIVD